MKMIEIRRHAKRNKPGANLTTEGIRRARNASAVGGEYGLVMISNLPRAVQTAVAMGHGVDEEDWTMATMGAALGGFPWEAGFAAMQDALHTDPVDAAWMTQQAAQLRHWLARVAPGRPCWSSPMAGSPRAVSSVCWEIGMSGRLDRALTIARALA